MKITPVILSGGAGTRLWPLSRQHFPKQLLPLHGDASMLQATLARVSDPARFAAPFIVANEDHRFIIADQLQAMGLEPAAIILEPTARNTAPAIALAALAASEDALLLVLPSDHVIADTAAFDSAVATAAEAALDGDLVLTFDPETAELVSRAGSSAGVLLSLPALEQAFGAGFEAALSELVRIWTTALTHGGAGVVAIGLAGLTDHVLTATTPIEVTRAKQIGDLVQTAAGDVAVGLFVDDPEAVLRLGQARFSVLETWQSADGIAVRRLRTAIASAIKQAGGDVEAAERHLFGRRTLVDAPGVNHAMLRAKGFTDVELEAVEQALAEVSRLNDAFQPSMLDSGFMRDVLGFDGVSDNLLSQLGFSEQAICAAEGWALGYGDLTGWDGIPEPLGAVLYDPDAFKARVRAEVDASSAVPDIAPAMIDWQTTPAQAARLLADAARDGHRAIRLMRAASCFA